MFCYFEGVKGGIRVVFKGDDSGTYLFSFSFFCLSTRDEIIDDKGLSREKQSDEKKIA